MSEHLMPDFDDDRGRIEAQLGEMVDEELDPAETKAIESQMEAQSNTEEASVLKRIAAGETPKEILNFYSIENEKGYGEARRILGDGVVNLLLERDKQVAELQQQVSDELKAGRKQGEILNDLGGPEQARLKIGKTFTDELMGVETPEEIKERELESQFEQNKGEN